MGGFESEGLAGEENRATLAGLNGRRVDRFFVREGPERVGSRHVRR
jgi:hypothetical protein